MKDYKEKESPKYQRVLTVGKELFWKHGVKRVSVKEICSQAAVSKMTFYRFFDNKIELAKAILEQVIAKGVADYEAVMAQPISFEEKMLLLMTQKKAQTQDISKEFLEDIYGNEQTELIVYMNQKSSDYMEVVLNDYRQAQANGEMRADIKPEFIMYFSGKMKEMLIDPHLQALYPNPQDLITEVTKFFFYGILNK